MGKKKQVNKVKGQVEVLKKENDLLKRKIEKLKNELRDEKLRFNPPYLESDDNVYALGSLHIGEYEGRNGNIVKLSIGYVEKALKILKMMDKKVIDIFVMNDFPCVLGSYDKKRKDIVGVIIAPRIEGDGERWV